MYRCVWRCLYPLSLTILFLTSQLALLKCFSPSRPLLVAAPGVQMLLELESHYEDTHQRLGEPFAEKAVVGSCQLWMRRRRRRRRRRSGLPQLSESRFVIQTCTDTTLQHAQADRVENKIAVRMYPNWRAAPGGMLGDDGALCSQFIVPGSEILTMTIVFF